MTVEELRQTDWILFECISGSHAYGLATEKSDEDRRGIFVLPTEEVLAGRYIEQINDKKSDIVFYEIGRFLDLLYSGNPNILELLNIPEDCLIYKHSNFDKWFPHPSKYLFKGLKNSFVGYAHTQINKARGLNKKISWDKEQTIRKNVLDFCTVVCRESGKTYKLKEWLKENEYKQEHLGLASIDGFRDCYRVYVDDLKWTKENAPNHRFNDIDFEDRNYKGVIKDDNTNQPRKSIIEKYMINDWKAVMYWNREAYSMHCKNYSSYITWLKERNEDRYKDNLKGEQGYDHKNMSHCFRLLNTAKDIIEKREIVVRRPEREFLLGIRNGEFSYDELIKGAEKRTDNLKRLFEESDLPKKLDIKEKQNLLLEIRSNG